MIARRAQLKASYQSQCHLAEKSMPNDFFATLYGLQLIVCSTVDYETLKNGILLLRVVISIMKSAVLYSLVQNLE